MSTFRSLGGQFRWAPEKPDLPIPMWDLPFPREEILSEIDACICPHVHPDHIDMGPD